MELLSVKNILLNFLILYILIFPNQSSAISWMFRYIFFIDIFFSILSFFFYLRGGSKIDNNNAYIHIQIFYTDYLLF